MFFFYHFCISVLVKQKIQGLTIQYVNNIFVRFFNSFILRSCHVFFKHHNISARETEKRWGLTKNTLIIFVFNIACVERRHISFPHNVQTVQNDLLWQYIFSYCEQCLLHWNTLSKLNGVMNYCKNIGGKVSHTAQIFFRSVGRICQHLA